MADESDANNSISSSGCSQTVPESYNLRKEINGKAERTLKYHENDSNSEKPDDLITLNGCGITTEWRYPKYINHCINLSCGLTFESRSDAINHYKEQHAANFILCSVCDKPISARNFKWHYEKIHPNRKIPSDVIGRNENSGHGFSHEEEESERRMTGNANYCEGDLVTLRGCGMETKWQFPAHLTRCPVLICNFASDSRSKLINHYKTKHAKYALLCDICNKPISVRRPNYFRRHFWRIHPNMKISYGLGKKMARKIKTRPAINQIKTMKPSNGKKVRCKYCNKILLSGSLYRHLSEMHSLKKINCPWKDCTFAAKRVTRLHQHWNRDHPNLRFPEIRKSSIFTYQTSLTSNINNNQEDVYQEISTLSAQQTENVSRHSLRLFPPCKKTGKGFLTDSSDEEDNIIHSFNYSSEENRPPEVSGTTTSTIDQSTNDEIGLHVQNLLVLDQNNATNPLIFYPENTIQVAGWVTIPTPTESNVEDDRIMFVSYDGINSGEQQIQAVIELSGAVNAHTADAQQANMNQNAEMDSVLVPALETSVVDAIPISDDQESIIDLSNDSDDDDDDDGDDDDEVMINTAENVPGTSHVHAMRVLMMAQPAQPVVEILSDDDEEPNVESEPRGGENGE